MMTCSKKTLAQIDSSFASGEAEQHSFYKDHFNGVDLHDRYWYKLAYSYQIRDWTTVYFFALLKVALINVYVLHRELDNVDLPNYVSRLASYLISPLL